MLTIHYGNRLEALAERLALVLARPLSAALACEEVVVQNHGMARWLSLELATRQGVLANTRFRFPAEFVWAMFEAVLEQVPGRSAFDPAVLKWRVLELLQPGGEQHPVPALQAYLAGHDDRRAYELAERLAGLFDQYQVYRPDWIRTWEQGGETHWQADLWRRLGGADDQHWVRLLDRFVETVQRGAFARDRVPERAALFGLASLSPTYLTVLQHLGSLMDLHLFVLNPCREYWGDVVAERDLAKRPAQAQQTLHFETGNSLLASLGKQGRDFVDLLQELGGEETDDFVEPQGGRLLQEIQRDILMLHERGGAAGGKSRVAADDRSLQVHSCHSPMREAEVLHDQLLRLFAEHRDLRASDMLVMTPDIEQYAPYIEAVFSSARDERYIPYSIADRPLASESPLTAAFLTLLELGDSRFDADSMTALLETQAVRRRFGFAEDELALVHRWVRESGIRWGIDAGHRQQLGLPATDEHSWRRGLDRLLLGVALPGDDRLFGTLLPYEVEGGETEVLGRLCQFADAVFEAGRRLTGRRGIGQWADELARLLDIFFRPADEEEPEAQAIRDAVEALREQALRGGFTAPVTLGVAQAHLQGSLGAPAEGSRFLRGGVTFCAMVPMRSIPQQVIALLGMNYDSVPRAHRPLSFDRMAGDFRRGDRSRRDDDRYLFLETLLSARRCLYISYVGQSVRDNSTVPPSVLVSELLDYVDQGFETGSEVPVREALLVRHPLQPFSPRYFEGHEPLFSYSRELCEASRASQSARAESVPLMRADLPEADETWRTVDVDRLVRFFMHPTRFLLRERLGVRLEEQEGLLETHEPFELDYDARRQLRGLLLRSHLEGEGPEQAVALARGAALLP
ncbi:MAG: exodeoxyribonuclease V subunit gamma, partial [Gammaproteobacteria bacterium]